MVLGKHSYSVELTITSKTSHEELSKKSRKSSMSGVLHSGGRSLVACEQQTGRSAFYLI